MVINVIRNSKFFIHKKFTFKDCLAKDTKYDLDPVLGIRGKNITDAISPNSCQDRCLHTLGCSYFSWFSANKTCTLHGPSAVAKNASNVTSGPNHCDPSMFTTVCVFNLYAYRF